MMIALVILPFYFAVLLGKLTQAVRLAEEASRAKSHFLAAMSHEFRTPLNAVIGMGEVLATTPLDADQRDIVATVRSAAAGLLGLVDDVLDLARLEARRFTVDDVPFDLHDLLATVRHLLFHAAAAKGLYLRLRLDPDTPYRLRGGARALRQVLLNLAANAVRFTETGGVVIDVRPVAAGPQPAPSPGAAAVCRLRFEVRDTGLGLSPEAQAKVFERFSQAEETRRRVTGGTGLGLSIVRELAELMGGEVGVESTPGRGSRFWLELPLTVPADGLGSNGDAAAEGCRGEVVVLAGSDAAAAVLDRLGQMGHPGRAVASTDAALELPAPRDVVGRALEYSSAAGRRQPYVRRRFAPLSLRRNRPLCAREAGRKGCLESVVRPSDPHRDPWRPLRYWLATSARTPACLDAGIARHTDIEEDGI
jgi:two-component system sensor histidine kinase RpfC